MMHFRAIWVRVWALPGTLLGLPLTPLFRTRRLARGVLLCEGARWPRALGFRYVAMTLGHVVLSVDAPIPPEVVAHEMVHVRQWERWGPAMIVAYPLGSLVAVLRGGHHYRDNPFERNARQEANSAFFP